MESTFKKRYEVNQKANGSIELIVKGRNAGAFAIARNPAGLGFLFLVIYVAAFVGISFLGEYLSTGFIDKHIGKSAITALAVPIYLLWLMLRSRNNVIILQPTGIIFKNGKKQISRKDIKSIGIATESVSTNTGYIETAYVYIDALGQRIAVTGHMEQALAESISGELCTYYN